MLQCPAKDSNDYKRMAAAWADCEYGCVHTRMRPRNAAGPNGKRLGRRREKLRALTQAQEQYERQRETGPHHYR